MSRTLEEAALKVRYHLRDRNPQSQAFTEPEVMHAIQSAVRLLAGDVLLGEEWISPFITWVAGTQSYATPSGTSVDAIRRLRTVSDGLEIPIVSAETFASYREGDDGSSTGQPQVATLREGPTQVLEVMFWPTPDRGGVVEAYRSALPAAFFTAGTAALAALPSATVIPFDDYAFEATCFHAARKLYETMTDERKARNQLGPNTGASWQEDEARCMRYHRERRRRQQSGTHTRPGRRW